MADFDIHLYFSEDSKSHLVWDSEFCHFLGVVLRQIFETPPRVITNMDLPGVTFNKELPPKDLSKIRAFIIIIGGGKELPDYAPIMNFLENLAPEQLSKVLLVRRPQKRIVEVPDFLKKFPSHNFYELAPHTQVVFEFNPNEKGISENSFWERLTDVAYDLKTMLFGKEKVEIPETRANTIFLAEVTPDQYKNRDRLRRELLLSGYNVLPDSPLPLDLKDFEDEVRNLMERSILSVHILGELYGNSPDGTDYSYQELQNRLFFDVSKKLSGFADVQPKMSRVVWIQPIFDPYDEKQIQYIKRLRRDISVSKDSELIQSTVLDLKNIIDQKFALLKSPLDDLLITEESGVLLIADDYRDIACSAIREEIHQASLNLTLLKTLANSHGNFGAILNEMKKYRNVLVLNTRGDNFWLQSILNLLARSKGYLGGVGNSTVGLFSPSQVKRVPQFHTISIESYIYNSKNISKITESFIQKIKA